MDAEDGGLPGSTHRQVSRACYPAVGIEIELGETPVLQCSRWEPDSEQARLDSIRQAYLKSSEGMTFAEQMEAFEEAERAERNGAAGAENDPHTEEAVQV
jgi:hypothetical protein